jgi:hypothetical protein
MNCQSVIPPGKLPLSFDIKGIEPVNDRRWNNASPESKRDFWKIAGRIAMEVKQRELSQGLDFAGRPLRPVTARITRYRSGQILDGKPLMPHRALSRTRRLLRYIVQTAQIRFYWALDWGKILDYHRRGAVLKRNGRCVGRLPVRNVFGISKKGREEIARRAEAHWRSGVPVEKPIDQTMEKSGVAIQLPMDTGRPVPATPEDFLAMGIKVKRFEATNYIKNRDTGLQGAKTPKYSFDLDWSKPGTYQRQTRRKKAL